MSEFRFQRVLDIKKKLLEHKQAELEIALHAVSTIEKEMNDVEKEMTETYLPLTNRCLTGSELTALTDYLAFLDRKRTGLRKEKQRREERVHEVRAELRALETERKVLEKLKAKALETVRKARNKKDQKLMDELALRIGSR